MTYQELVDAAQAYADRYDEEVSKNIPLFILMAESRMNRVLKTRKQSARVYSNTLTGQEFYALPPDYAGMRDIQINSEEPLNSDYASGSFNYLNPEQMNIQRNQPPAGRCYYTIIGDQIQIYPMQDTGKALEIVYFQKVPPLTDVNINNWMSLDHPDIYVSGVVTEIELFVKNYDVAEGWAKRLVMATNELSSTDVLERWSGSAMTIKVG
jgi:hypothetical protein